MAVPTVPVPPGPSNVPIPDPSVLTTAQLQQAISNLREVIEARLDAMDDATKLVAAGLNSIRESAVTDNNKIEAAAARQLASLREYVIQQITAVKELLVAIGDKDRAVSEEKFSGVYVRFTERDERTAQAAQESRISLDAALAAAKEAVSEQNKANTLAIGKSERSTEESLRALERRMDAINTAIMSKIEDIVERLNRSEGADRGHIEQKTTQNTNRDWTMTVVVALIGIVAVAISLIGLLK